MTDLIRINWMMKFVKVHLEKCNPLPPSLPPSDIQLDFSAKTTRAAVLEPMRMILAASV